MRKTKWLRPAVNVGPFERIACGLAAGWLLAGILRGKRKGLGSLLLAGALSYRALTGNCKGYEILGSGTCSRD